MQIRLKIATQVAQNKKDLARVFPDCVFNTQRKVCIRLGTRVLKRSRGLVCCSDLELFTVTF